MVMGPLDNFSGEVSEVRSSVRVEEELVVRGGWLDREQLTEIEVLGGLKCVIGYVSDITLYSIRSGILTRCLSILFWINACE